MSMEQDGEFRRNPSVAARGFTSIEAMEFIRREFPKVTAWTYWEVGHIFMGRLVDGKQWQGSIGTWRWEAVSCSYPALLIWDSKAKRDGSLVGSNWTGVLKVTGPDNIEFLLFSHLNAMGGIGTRFLISTQNPVVIEKFSELVYTHYFPQAHNELSLAGKIVADPKVNEATKLLLSAGLNVLAARPGQGKTSLALMLANFMVKQHRRRVLYLSAAQGIEQLRLCAQKVGLSPSSLLKLAPAQQTPVSIVVDDHSHPDIDRLLADSSSLDDDLGLIVVDQLQRLDCDMATFPAKPEGNGCDLGRLEEFATSCNIPILLLSHLRRPIANRWSAWSLTQLPDFMRVEPYVDVICAMDSFNLCPQKNEAPVRYQIHVLKDIHRPVVNFPISLGTA